MKKLGKKLGMKISQVQKGSIGEEIGLKKGDEILSINSTFPNDIFEYSFLEQVEDLELHVKHKNDEEEIIEIEKDFEDNLGLSFENAVFDYIKPCTNKCIFCFVDGQPKGLRKSLYVKDDDWRLSYLQGTYITMTNLTEKDWERIEQLRPSPLYISVHTTNPDLREKMLQNPRAGKIMENLKRLSDLGIEIHTQIVLCQKYNDSNELRRTLDDLKKIKKNLKSCAIVPVGISKHHQNKLDGVDKKTALETIKIIEKFNEDLKKNIAMASDEFFLTAGIQIPEKKYYGKFHQIEDGVGAIRLYLDDFKKQKSKLKPELKNPQKLGLITSEGAMDMFLKIKKEMDVKGLELDLIAVKNNFFGDRINVTGLICGIDILNTLREKVNKGEKITNLIIPSVMLRADSEEFLDDVTLNDIKKEFNAEIFVIKNCYSFKELANIINSF